MLLEGFFNMFVGITAYCFIGGIICFGLGLEPATIFLTTAGVVIGFVAGVLYIVKEWKKDED